MTRYDIGRQFPDLPVSNCLCGSELAPSLPAPEQHF